MKESVLYRRYVTENAPRTIRVAKHLGLGVVGRLSAASSTMASVVKIYGVTA